MINHFRTLLLNANGDGLGGILGDQYIPPSYRALTLPTAAVVLRRCLFGSDPDRVMLNYRSQQLLVMLGCTELQQFVAALDSRITYALDDAALFSPTNFLPRISPAGNAWVQGDLASPDATGRTTYSWLVTQTGSSIATRQLTPPMSVSNTSLILNGSLSNLIALPGSSLTFRFRQGVTSQWRIDAVARPTQSLGAVEAALRQSGEPNILEIFGIGGPRGEREPWLTFANLWLEHPELPYSLGGLVLGLVYYTEQLRLGQL